MQKSNTNINNVSDKQMTGLHIKKESRSSHIGEMNQENEVPHQKSYSYRNNQNVSQSSANHVQGLKTNGSVGATSIVNEYRTFTKHFFSSKQAEQVTHSVINNQKINHSLQPQIMQNHSKLIDNSQTNYSQYNNKENIENKVQGNGHHNSQGRVSNSFNKPTQIQGYQQQITSQNAKGSQVCQNPGMNKTTSFLTGAGKYMQNNMNTNQTQQQVSNNNVQYYQSNQSNREFGRDISSLATGTQAVNGAQIKPTQNKEAYHNSNNRIPQPSIINSATGNMNHGEGYESRPNVTLTLNHSKSQLDHQPTVNNFIKTPTAVNAGVSRGLQNPRIIDKKFTLSNMNKGQQSTSNQSSHRYLSKDTHPNSSQQNLNQSQYDPVVRKSSHTNNSSVGQNVFKRLRSGNGNNSATATSRYSTGAINNNNNAKRMEQKMRNVQLDKRLNELKRAQGSNQGSQVIEKDKYANKHQVSHQQDRVMNSTVNKSGEINSQFQKNLHKAKTQRQNSGLNSNTRSGRNSGTQSISGAVTGLASSSGYLQPSFTKSKQTIPKQTISKVAEKLIGEHNQRQTDKENQLRAKIHDPSHRSRLSENSHRGSGMHSRVSTHQSNIQPLATNHIKSKNSDAEMTSSINASGRNSISKHNTTRSQASKSAGRSNYSDVSKQMIRKKSEKEVSSREKGSSASNKQGSVISQPPQIMTQALGDVQNQESTQQTQSVESDPTMRLPDVSMSAQPFTTGEINTQSQEQEQERTSNPFRLADNGITIPEQISQEMETRRKNWLKQYKTKLDLNDVLEIRNPQSVVEFLPEIYANMKVDEVRHMYPSNFLEKSFQEQISEKYRQYLVDWLAELHYKFKMWPETLYVTVGIIDKILMRWQNYQKSDLQCLGITALHIAGKYEEIYPPELKTILKVIDNAVTRDQVCVMETKILQCLDFDMVWPSILRFMERYSIISNYNKEQQMIAQMLTDFILLEKALLLKKPSLLGAVVIYATNMITNKSRPWNNNLVKCTQFKEEDVKPLAKQLFYFIKKLEQSSLKTLFRKYELDVYLGVVKVISKIQMPQQQPVYQQTQSEQQSTIASVTQTQQ